MIRRRQDSDVDAGFSLVEPMVVVLVIAVQLAIAIPTFLGSHGRSRDRPVPTVPVRRRRLQRGIA